MIELMINLGFNFNSKKSKNYISFNYIIRNHIKNACVVLMGTNKKKYNQINIVILF